MPMNYATYKEAQPNVSVAGARLQAMREGWEQVRKDVAPVLRVASIVLPYNSDTLEAHTQLRANLLEHFGGYTQYTVSGAWRDETTLAVYHDVSEKYEVAMLDNFTNRTTFRALARVAGMEASQLSVFVVFPDGTADIIEIDSSEANDRRQLAHEAAQATAADSAVEHRHFHDMEAVVNGR